MTDFVARAEALAERTRRWRRDFHRHPELGFQEVRTAGIVAGELQSLGLEVTTGIAETGVIGVLEGASPGRTVLLRFDMDALPIQEATGAPYASETDGVMHACGHDGHTAIGLTVARMLQESQADLAGTFKFVFQPAEEGLGGARRMVAEGALDDPRPDLALAAHLWNYEPVGWLGVTAGPLMAASDFFTVQVTGRGGHAARPERARDPVVAAAHLITALQSVVSRNVSPLEAAVLSVASVHAGETHNVIPDTVTLQGTLRTFLPEVRATALDRVTALVEGLPQALGCQGSVEFHDGTPAVVNDSTLAAKIQDLTRRLFPEATLETGLRTTVSEDMSFFTQSIPGCYLLVGSADPDRGLHHDHHHPKFDFDEAALPRAASVLAEAAAALGRQ